MAAEQNKMQAITQGVIEATKAAIMATREADNLVHSARPVQTTSRKVAKGLNSQHSTENQKTTKNCEALR